MMAEDVAAAQARLDAVLDRLGPLAIAVSGGVDSMTLAYLAHRRDGSARMVHAQSPAVPADATERVHRHAARFGWTLETTSAAEFEDPDYLKNPVNRCFFCKTNLYQRIAALTDRQIASGANLDDLSDYRPGLIAAAENKVVHPLVEAGINKSMVRRLAAYYGLNDLAELPAQPCLSSRIETGIGIDPGDLAFVHAVETAVRAYLPLADIRCRITRDGVVLELDPFEDAQVRQAAETASDMARGSGRIFVSARPYRRGSAFIGKPEGTGRGAAAQPIRRAPPR
jgi:pyridinium-3,5-biscarboxylic acid mononucleotide sulfurtransferase